MKQTQSLFQIERRLTPELFDHYVAKARAERAKAIAKFGGHLVKWLSGLAARLARRRQPVRTGRKASAPIA
jgi:hypothetical protein